MNTSQIGRQIHAQAEEARERGELLQALIHTDEAIVAYQADKDLLGLAEVLSSRQSTFKHLYRQTQDPVYLILEKYTAKAAVKVAKLSGIPQALALPYHNLGKYYFEAKKYKKAGEYFRKAADNLQTYSDNPHSRPSVISDIRGHQYTAEFFAGDKGGVDRAEEALRNLEAADEPSKFLKNVWVSGACLRLAEMYFSDKPEETRKYIEKAKNIIDADERLVLRKEQLSAMLDRTLRN